MVCCFDMCSGLGNGDTGQSDLVGVLLARESDLCASNFQPSLFFYAWVFVCDLAGGSAAELEMKIKSPGACLIVQVKRRAPSPCLTVESQKRCPDLHLSAGTWSFSSLLHKGPSQLLPPAGIGGALHERHVRAQKRASGWELGWSSHLGS